MKEYLAGTLFVALCCSGILQAEEWVHFAPEGGEFSVEMPSKPELDRSVDRTPIGAIEQNLYTTTYRGGDFSVEYSDLPEAALLLAGKSRIFEEAKKNLLKSDEAMEISFEAITLEGHPGKALTYESDGVKGGARFYLVHHRFFVLDARLSEEDDEEMLERFFNSFQLQSE